MTDIIADGLVKFFVENYRKILYFAPFQLMMGKYRQPFEWGLRI
jgi:hypothetical protein